MIQDHFCERLTHPTDLDPSSEHAFQHALAIALACEGHLRLVHVDPDVARSETGWQSFPGVRRTLAHWGLIGQDAEAADIAPSLGLRVSKHALGAMEPIGALEKFLEDHATDLVVFGLHHREGLDRLLHASVPAPLARRVRIPALFVPGDGRGFIDRRTGAAHLRNVLIPVDQFPDATKAIQRALALSQLLKEDTRFHLLHVGAAVPAAVQTFTDDARIRIIHGQGPVVETIIETAHSIGADLIVMATEGRDGVFDVFRGSTTEQVLRQAKRAVLAIPA